VEKTGLRTTANGPSVTRAVCSAGSTPMRHEAPMASWAQNVRAMPARASTRPQPATRGLSNHGSTTSTATSAGATATATRARQVDIAAFHHELVTMIERYLFP
jgi:hypothetical protein